MGPGRGHPRGIQGHRRRRLSSCKSTIPPWSTSGTGGTRSTATWPAIANGPPFRSKRRIMHCGASRKSACVSIFAGAAGMVRTAAICRSRTSWICCSRSRHRPILSRQGTSGTSTSGRCGRTKLPDGKVLIPGVVSHSTNLIEHPELVADRIIRFAHVVGRENVIAGTDCGLGGRVHLQIAWAKLRALGGGEAGKQKAVDLARACVNRGG